MQLFVRAQLGTCSAISSPVYENTDQISIPRSIGDYHGVACTLEGKVITWGLVILLVGSVIRNLCTAIFPKTYLTRGAPHFLRCGTGLCWNCLERNAVELKLRPGALHYGGKMQIDYGDFILSWYKIRSGLSPIPALSNTVESIGVLRVP